MKSQYLLRLDDFCPTMNWSVWRAVERILVDASIRPILAVVPDNRDSSLWVGEENKSFWKEVRVWQARGWTIGLHGFQHVYSTKDPGLLKLRGLSEFSGLSYAEQRSKLEQA